MASRKSHLNQLGLLIVDVEKGRPEIEPAKFCQAALARVNSGVDVSEQAENASPYVISYARHGGAHFGSMCLTRDQLYHVVQLASELLGIELVEFDDYTHPELEDNE